jgi:Flp pilus assembly protein TadG
MQTASLAPARHPPRRRNAFRRNAFLPHRPFGRCGTLPARFYHWVTMRRQLGGQGNPLASTTPSARTDMFDASHSSARPRLCPRARFARGRRGSVLTWAALLMVPLIGFMGLGVDTARAYLVKARLGQALDAATLAAGRTSADQATSEEKAKTVFKANFPTGFMDAAVAGPAFAFNNTDHTVKGTASAAIPTYFVRLVGRDTFTVSASVEVKRNANSLEIALALDVTGSMSGSKITDLKKAAKDLIDTVVWEDQGEYYSKVAIVPWTNAVNVGSYAAQVRGAVPAAKAITGATKASPVVVTSANHGFNNGDKVFISGVKGMTQINNNLANSSTATTNPQYWVVANKTTNSFALKRSDNTNADGKNWSTYTSAGAIDCMTAGCPYYFFNDAAGGTKVFAISNCVSERTGSQAYTDAPPSTALLGRVYPAPNNPCVTTPILPLTSNKNTLKATIDGMAISGSTAGQIGTAWAWYMISPNFAYLWPGASAPAPYGTDELLKIAVIMTDGDYNTAYCNGVISKDSGTGSGNASDHINCNATNGSSASQALQQCAAMKAKGIIVFTIGFDLETQAAKNLMKQCASTEAYAYIASDGAALQQAFRSIAINISRLRLSR